ncbi:RAM signaling network component [Malassezia cuniculi]|uniref:RAM signaling network component n=1 Tax=Malassezia cuniculi TaxID=948313 RepID=A0AAF0ES15_9BASI|nr:RAM signaling network component [Malassezia cuniculi]
MGTSGDALEEALGDALRPLRLGRQADADTAYPSVTSTPGGNARTSSPASTSSMQPGMTGTPSPGPSSAPVSARPGHIHSPPGNGLPSAPSTVPRPPGGLRMLSLPTVGATQAAAEAAAAAMQQQRREPEIPDTGASYFKRFSLMQRKVPTVKTPSPQVLKSVDAVRGILFALSQIYSALKQYIGVVGDERLAGSFNRMLTSAGLSLSALISALDAFDAQRAQEPPVVRAVVEAARDGVLVFRRIVRALSGNLEALEQSVDARFSRTLLVMLYGSIAEVCNSAAALSANMHAVVPLLSQTQSPDALSTLVTPVRAGFNPSPIEKHRAAQSLGNEQALEDGEGSTISMLGTSTPSTHIRARTLSPAVSPDDGARSSPGLFPRRANGSVSGSDVASVGASISASGGAATRPTTHTPQAKLATPGKFFASARSNSSSSLRDFRAPPSIRGAGAGMGADGMQSNVPIDIHLLGLLSQAADRSVNVWSDVHVHTRARAATLDGVHYGDDDGEALRDVPLQRVRELGGQSTEVLDQARQLQDALSVFSWGNYGHAQRLWEIADQFVRSTIHVAALIRDMPAAAALPAPLMRRVGEAALSCAALASHLHRLHQYATK